MLAEFNVKLVGGSIISKEEKRSNPVGKENARNVFLSLTVGRKICYNPTIR